MRARVLEYSPLGPDGPRLRWRRCDLRPRRHRRRMAYAWRALDRLGLGQRLGSCNLDAEIGRSPSDGTRRSPNNASNDVGPLAARCQIAQFRDAPWSPEAWRPHLAGILGSHGAFSIIPAPSERAWALHIALAVSISTAVQRRRAPSGRRERRDPLAGDGHTNRRRGATSETLSTRPSQGDLTRHFFVL